MDHFCWISQRRPRQLRLGPPWEALLRILLAPFLEGKIAQSSVQITLKFSRFGCLRALQTHGPQIDIHMIFQYAHLVRSHHCWLSSCPDELSAMYLQISYIQYLWIFIYVWDFVSYVAALEVPWSSHKESIIPFTKTPRSWNVKSTGAMWMTTLRMQYTQWDPNYSAQYAGDWNVRAVARRFMTSLHPPYRRHRLAAS